ncbi:MAG: DUF1045 domain-containing protein [Roseibium sp.]|uniref:DUF1045 domain-containing protein n=1 Tax=Roseibium sp. TaxID=1936156 RepID=UPI003D9C441E
MRYAIYFAADADDALMRLGNAWLGRDPFAATDPDMSALTGLNATRFRELTADPRRYGFHGTLKAPFHLKPGMDEADLITACRKFASDLAPFRIEALNVNRLGKFLALTPDRPQPDLSAFAALCVRQFEPYRAPLSEADLERRRKSGLTPKQDAYLTDWGYPYVFDEMRFHMTLSNKLDSEHEAAELEEAAKSHFAAVTGKERACSSFALYQEPERGAPFDVHTVFQLTGTTPVGSAGTRPTRPTDRENA